MPLSFLSKISSFTKKLSSSKKQWVISATAIITLLLALMYTAQAIKHQPQPAPRQIASTVPTVSVIEAQSNYHTAHLAAYGEAKPRYALALPAEVAGRVIEVAARLEPGTQVQKGEILAHLDSTDYQQAVALAEQTLAQAKLKLLLEQRESDQAKNERKKDTLNQQPSSDLALRYPQIIAARAGLKQARAALKQAQKKLANTRITAPFDAIITERRIAPGQYMQEGDPIATLYSSDRMDVRISLPAEQWRLLPQTDELIGQSIATLTDNHGQQWPAAISAVEQHIDKNNRQRSLVLSVDHPLQHNPPLLAGTFLQIEIHSPVKAQLLAVPAASLTNAGHVWYVTQKKQLAYFEADIVFQQQGTLFITPPEHIDAALRVLTAPLLSYLPGQAVEPRIKVQEEH